MLGLGLSLTKNTAKARDPLSVISFTPQGNISDVGELFQIEFNKQIIIPNYGIYLNPVIKIYRYFDDQFIVDIPLSETLEPTNVLQQSLSYNSLVSNTLLYATIEEGIITSVNNEPFEINNKDVWNFTIQRGR